MTESVNHTDIIRLAQANLRAQGTSRPRQPSELSPGQQEKLQLQETCREFESVFVAYLLKEMRATVDKSGLVDGGQSEQLYQSLMDTEIAREISHAGGLGLAKMLYQQLAARHDGGGESTRSVSSGQGGNGPQRPEDEIIPERYPSKSAAD